MAQRRYRGPLCAALLLVVAALIFFTRTLWLPAIGYALIHDDGPAHADIAVVLAGDQYGHRILTAGELVKQGYVPAALVSGPAGQYDWYESDLAIPYAVRHGYPAASFIAFPNYSLSTQDEAEEVVSELRRRGVHRFLLVTSSFHSARATRIYRSVLRASGLGLTFRTVASVDQFFRPDTWWQIREGRKTVLLEWTKTIASAFGL